VSEPDEDTIRRWQEYTRSPGSASAESVPASESERPEPPRTSPVPPPSTFSARRMAMAGLAFFAVLAVLALLFTWPSGAPVTGDPTSPRRAADRAGDGNERNLVTPWVPLAGTGTIISGAPAVPGFTLDKMEDGDPRSQWRMTGSGTNRRILLELDAKSVVSAVALAVPQEGCRPIRQVVWSFKDQAAVQTQAVKAGSSGPQRISVPALATSAVTLSLADVGPAPSASADFTCISEIQIFGH
jgi:hypothetical protein